MAKFAVIFGCLLFLAAFLLLFLLLCYLCVVDAASVIVDIFDVFGAVDVIFAAVDVSVVVVAVCVCVCVCANLGERL